MSQQNTILNGPSGELTMAFKDAQSLQDTIQPSGNTQPSTIYCTQNNGGFIRPPLTRIDSRSTLPVRPNFQNQQGLQFRPPQQRPPGTPQYIQRNPGILPQRQPGSIQQQQQPQNVRPYVNQPINAGLRPSTPFPPRPQGPIIRTQGIVQQRSVPATFGQQKPPFSGEQVIRSQTLDSTDTIAAKNVESTIPTTPTEITKEDMTPKPSVAAMKSRSYSLSSNVDSTGSFSEDRRRSVSSIGSVEEQQFQNSTDDGKAPSDYPSRPESRTGTYMNKIVENEIDYKTNGIDSGPISFSQTKIEHSFDIPTIERHKQVEENKIQEIKEEAKKDTITAEASSKELKEPPKLHRITSPRIKPPKSLSPAKSEGDNDSGVDESMQGNDPSSNGEHSASRKSSSKTPSRNSASPTKNRSFSRGTKSPHPKTPDSGASTPGTVEKKKLPMNKIQVGAAPSPNLKVVKSKIGSLENTTYKPGGGRVKIENKKIDFTNTQSRITAKNDSYVPGGGDKKIQQQKLQWSAKSKIGSLENTTHKPKGGDKKIETVKLDFKEKAKSKVGSKDNMKHVPGGGDIKSEEIEEEFNTDIENKKLDIKVQSKVGSLDNMKHRPGGGDKKIFDDKEYMRQKSSMSNENKSMSGSQNSLPSQTDNREPVSDENLNSER